MEKLINDKKGRKVWVQGHYRDLGGGGWCFIATAAYGTPFAQEIDALRDWRDYTLQKSILGRTFVKTYYAISPPIANFIRNKPKLRRVVRVMLRPVVALAKKYKNAN